MRKHLTIGLLVTLLSTLSFGQTATICTTTLEQAEQAFDQGRLLYILDRSANAQFYNCLENDGFTWNEKVRAYKLLTKTFLFTDNEPEAERSFMDLLRVNKEHQLAADDPAELYFLYSKFNVDPILRVSLRGGVNKSLPNLIEVWQPGKLYNQEGANTGLGVSFWGEVMAERHIKNGIEVGLGLNLWNLTYEMEGTSGEGSLFYTAKNSSTNLRIPLMGKYNFRYNKKDEEGVRYNIMPYVFGGVSYDLLLSAKYVDTSRGGGQAFTLPEEDADLKAFGQVSESNLSLFAGAGIKMRMGRSKVDFLTFEARFDNQLFNYIDPDNRFANSVVVENIGLVEDDLTLNAVSISVGYTRSFYSPRKKKQYK
jgi:hypothetical protein